MCALAAAPVLAIYNSRRETELHRGASSHGFGAVRTETRQQ